MKVAAAVGISALVLHVIGLPAALKHFSRNELAVDITTLPVAESFDLTGTLPANLGSSVELDVDGAPAAQQSIGPGLHTKRWTTRYRGGVVRSVTSVQLAGPFQDPTTPTCTAQIAIGQGLLDDGSLGPGTIAAAVARELTATLTGLEVFPIGKFTSLHSLTLQFAERGNHPEDRALVGKDEAPGGYIRAAAMVGFQRVNVPAVLVFIPNRDGASPSFTVRVAAKLDWDNRALQWLNNKLGGNKLATHFANQELDKLLVTALAPPPPVALPGGGQLSFAYCGAPLQILNNASAALPLSVTISPGAGATAIVRPVLRGAPTETAPAVGRQVTLDLDFDGVDAILYELWRQGVLTRELDKLGLDRTFNSDPTVVSLLSIRVSPLRLPLPPVLSVRNGQPRLGAELLLNVGDAQSSSAARLWGALDLRLDGIAPTVDLGDFELTCEPRPSHLEPCYADLVATLRQRAPDAHALLTSTFTDLLARLFVGTRLATSELPATMVIDAVAASATVAGQNGQFRLLLAARVE